MDDGTGSGHGFEIIEYDINQVIRSGETEIIQFEANQIGSFTFKCSVECGIGHNTMAGTLVVG